MKKRAVFGMMFSFFIALLVVGSAMEEASAESLSSSLGVVAYPSKGQSSNIGLGWSLAINRYTGNMKVTFAGGDAAFIIFGACTSTP